MEDNSIYDSNTFIKSGNKLKCKLCNCWMQSENVIKSHINGRKHTLRLTKSKEKDEKLKRSIYIKGFDPALESLEDEIHSHFEDIGGTIKDVYIDKNSANYCIIEFVEEVSVNKAIISRKSFHGKRLVIRQREEGTTKQPKENVADIKKKDTVDGYCPKELEEILREEKDLRAQMKAIHNYWALTTEELKMRSLICQLLQTVLEEAYPGCSIKIFGSTVNQLGIHDCDLDLTLLYESSQEQNEFFKETREIIERYAPGFKNVLLVKPSKTCSVLKMVHVESGINVDLSFNNRLAIENSMLLKQYVTCNNETLFLFTTLRYWGKVNQLTGRSGLQISNYTLTLIFIYYLQQLDPPYLLCLQECHHENNTTAKSVIIDGYNCSFCKDHSPLNKTANDMGSLLTGFFKFFEDFLYTKNVVGVHTRKILSRSQSIHDLNTNTPLVVQDPFDSSHNVAQNLTMHGLEILRSAFTDAYKLLTTSTTLSTIFSKEHISKQREKSVKRHKKNRHEYIISLPNCKHCVYTESEKSLEGKFCFDAVVYILTDTLKMKLKNHEEKQASEISEITSISAEENNGSTDVKSTQKDKTAFKQKKVETHSSLKLDKDDLFRKHCQKVGIKRTYKETVEKDESSQIKKQKLESQDHVMEKYLAYAYSRTWTNRRKEKRRMKREQLFSSVIIGDTSKDARSELMTTNVTLKEEKTENNPLEKHVDEIHMTISESISKTTIGKLASKEVESIAETLENDSSATTNKMKPTSIEMLETNDSTVNPENDQSSPPILCVSVSVKRKSDHEDVCKVKFDPFKDNLFESNIDDFQIFFAYVKKELLNLMK